MNENVIRILFIMPCHNEQGRVGHVLKSVHAAFPSSDIAVVDDCSTDSSTAEAQAAGAIILRHECNLGYGAALQTGYMYALQKNYDILVQLDADGQHDIASAEAIIAPVKDGKADLVLGSRHLSTNSSPTPTIRRLGQKVFSATIRLFGGPSLTDPTSGFQALNRKALTLFGNDVFPCDYPDSDVILMAHYAGLRVEEQPVTMLARSGGTSLHSGLKPLYYGIKMLFSMIIVFLNRGNWKRLGTTLPTSKQGGSSNAA
jgi:glycosyltransferase involved in cell wall biosynthesis